MLVLRDKEKCRGCCGGGCMAGAGSADGFVDNASALPTTPQPPHRRKWIYDLPGKGGNSYASGTGELSPLTAEAGAVVWRCLSLSRLLSLGVLDLCGARAAATLRR